MQVGDALVGIHHVKRWTACQNRLYFCQDSVSAIQFSDFAQHVTKTRIRIDPRRIERSAVCFEHWREVLADAVTEDDRVRNLHHCGLHVQRVQRALDRNVGDRFVKECLERRDRHKGRVNDGARRHFQPVLQHFAVQLNTQARRIR